MKSNKNKRIIESVKNSLDKLELSESEITEYFESLKKIQVFNIIFMYLLVMINIILSGIILYWIKIYGQ